MLQDRIEPAPEACSAPNMSRHGRFPTSAGYFQPITRGLDGSIPLILVVTDGRYSRPARACKPNGNGLLVLPLCSGRGECPRPRGARVSSSGQEDDLRTGRYLVTRRWDASTAQAARLWVTLRATSTSRRRSRR